MMKTIIALGLVASVAARCDNACSGHGSCMYDDVCSCHDNWGLGLSMDSGDCSDRICPFELAWVDTPGDSGAHHKYAECAGKGICDRETAECECFEGYEGKGCQRTSCPNDCSGHGTCEYIEDLGYAGSFANPIHTSSTGNRWADSAHTFNYYGWDKGKTRGCLCDSQWADADCSKRMCPYATDILDQREMLLDADQHQVQTLEFIAQNNTQYRSDLAAQFDGQTFALSFRSKLNETFTTIPIAMHTATAELTDLANDVKLALLTLPNKVITGVGVTAEVLTANTGVNNGVKLTVTFSGDSVQGPQNLLWAEAYECSTGCTPKITGLDIKTVTAYSSHSAEKTASDFNSYECGRRGRCDYESGLCECFSGYTGENCNTLTTLV